jgi:hypothetical protein
MARRAIDRGDKRGDVQSTWAKVSFDRQIIAIAKVNGVDRLYSDDEDVAKHGKREGLKVISVAALPLPPPSQDEMFKTDNSQ